MWRRFDIFGHAVVAIGRDDGHVVVIVVVVRCQCALGIEHHITTKLCHVERSAKSIHMPNTCIHEHPESCGDFCNMEDELTGSILGRKVRAGCSGAERGGVGDAEHFAFSCKHILGAVKMIEAPARCMWLEFVEKELVCGGEPVSKFTNSATSW